MLVFDLMQELKITDEILQFANGDSNANDETKTWLEM